MEKSKFLRARIPSILGILIVATACATGPNPPVVVDPLAISGPAATVTVLRKNQLFGSLHTEYLVVDDRPVAALRGGQYTIVQVPAGSHSFAVVRHLVDGVIGAGNLPLGLKFGLHENEAKVEVREDGNYRLLISPEPFTLDKDDQIKIEQVDQWPGDATLDPARFVRTGRVDFALRTN